ncbi:MAG: c-type cytochrome domain-containing protein [Gemmataceae bacterium]
MLIAECHGCHSTEKGKKVRGGLALDTRAGLRKGGDSGPAIVPR